jgi:hypothetical protein
VKHNHKLILAFALGWLAAAILPPQTVLGGLKSKAKS